MIDKRFIEEKVNLITRDLSRLSTFSAFTISQMAEDYMKYGALKNMLMEIIGRAIDINQHLLSELSETKAEIPKSYKETFLALAKLGVVPVDFAQKISKSAGFRNAIVHEYNNLDKNIVYRTALLNN